jgi:hemoglobin
MQSKINNENLYQLVDEFYAKIRLHTELGKIFKQVITNWEEHLVKITEFWKGVMMKEGNYEGNPLKAHLQLPNFNLELFGEWLRLFHETADEIFTPEISAEFKAKSNAIAFNLKNIMSCKKNDFLSN